VGTDQLKLVERLTMPIAILNGADDPFINLGSISFKNL
jgi:predicted alpha/beta-fold hydrolase